MKTDKIPPRNSMINPRGACLLACMLLCYGYGWTQVRPFVVSATIDNLNLGFENNLSFWNATGNAFANQPVKGNTVMTERVLSTMEYSNGGIGGDYWKGLPYPIGIKGSGWIGTYEKGNGDAPTGALTSTSFKASKRYLHFLMGGGKDINALYVELQVKLDDYQSIFPGRNGFYGNTDDGFTRVNRLTPSINSEEMFRYYFDLQEMLKGAFDGKTIRLCIVDNSNRGWGHINVDDFVQDDDISDFIIVKRGGFTLYADKDKPVFGFADTHAHWVNHVGLKGLMHGTPGGNWQTSDVRRDIPPCDGFNHGLPSITPAMLVAQTEKAAWNRAGERMVSASNLACMSGVAVVSLADWPSTLIGAAHTGMGALWGAIGQQATGAQSSTGALDGTITNAVWAFATNPAFQSCGHGFAKDIFARHYGNYIPEGNPEASNYVDFPRWNSFFHQTMHTSWVRRSFDGGQRLMVVPVGVAKSWEFNATADGSMTDARQHIANAVAELKRIVSQNSDWLQIAYSPREAREIIHNNKMAVVIALEQGEVGNYFQSVQEEVSWLENLGIRHVFPIHNINNRLGGTAIFNSTVLSYNDLVNRSGADGAIVPFKVKEGITGGDTYTTVKLNRTFMRQGMRTLPIAGFGTIPFFYMNDVPASYNYERYTSHKNAEGLSDRGRTYLNALMKKGMIIDVDHMSDASQDEAMNQMKRYQYPMISGHTNFRKLRHEKSSTSGDCEPRLKTEFTIHPARATEISSAGGMFGLMTQQNNIQAAAGCPVENNAAGGSPSFAQAYWYALQKTGNNQGIAFGSDFNGFAPQIAPRFGVDAGFMLEGDDLLNISTGSRTEDKLRRTQALQQTHGVRYDQPIRTYHYHRFLKPSFLTSEEREIWEALAIAKCGLPFEKVWQPGGGLSVERTDFQRNKIANMALGFRTRFEGNYLQVLECPEYLSRIEDLNNCMPERKAAFLCVHGIGSLPDHMKTHRTKELYRVMEPIYRLWMSFENGPNEPLRRSYAYNGGRDFDFNLDGLAHYGMYPDLIQDLKNLGIKGDKLNPLFMGTEQYLKMWEQADKAKQNPQLMATASN